MKYEEIEKIILEVQRDLDDRYPDENDMLSLTCGTIRYEIEKAYKKKGIGDE